MARRSRLPPTFPEGWIEHDGSPCPVHPESRPAVMFRHGGKTRMGAYSAKALMDWHRDPWQWKDRQQGQCDIIAYLAEPDDFVAIERLDLRHSC